MTATERTRRQFGIGVVGVTSLFIGGCLGDDDDHDHTHDDTPWEWGGMYDLDSGTYTYAYHEGPDPEMEFAVIPADEGGEHDLFHAGETATDLFEKGEAETVVTTGDTVRPSSEALNRVDFEASGETTMELVVESDGYYSIFTAHVPEEFDAELRSESDEELTPETTELQTDHTHEHGTDEDDEH